MDPLRTYGSEGPSWNYVMLPNTDMTPSPQTGKARVNFPAEMLIDESENYYRPSLMSRRSRSMSAWSELSSSWKLDERMSIYFFRLHNLRRAQEEDKRKKQQQQQQQRQQQHRTRRGTIVHRYPVNTSLTLAPSRLFERPPLTPSDSLDEVALQIPRCHKTPE